MTLLLYSVTTAVSLLNHPPLTKAMMLMSAQPVTSVHCRPQSQRNARQAPSHRPPSWRDWTSA